MFGNTNQPIDVMVQTGHLFAPMPDIIRDDMAFIDRLHFYLPGWEIPKMRNELFTDHYGFVVDYLAEALRELRKHNFTEIIDRHFSLGAHLNARDRKAVRQDRLRPDEDPPPARRGHRRTSSRRSSSSRSRDGGGSRSSSRRWAPSSTTRRPSATRVRRPARRRFVGVPEQGGRDLISADPLAPGHRLHASASRRDGTVGLYRVEVSRLERHRQAEAGRRRRGRDEGVGPARLQLPAGQEDRARHRAATSTPPTSTSR